MYFFLNGWVAVTVCWCCSRVWKSQVPNTIKWESVRRLIPETYAQLWQGLVCNHNIKFLRPDIVAVFNYFRPLVIYGWTLFLNVELCTTQPQEKMAVWQRLRSVNMWLKWLTVTVLYHSRKHASDTAPIRYIRFIGFVLVHKVGHGYFCSVKVLLDMNAVETTHKLSISWRPRTTIQVYQVTHFTWYNTIKLFHYCSLHRGTENQ